MTIGSTDRHRRFLPGLAASLLLLALLAPVAHGVPLQLLDDRRAAAMLTDPGYEVVVNGVPLPGPPVFDAPAVPFQPWISDLASTGTLYQESTLSPAALEAILYLGSDGGGGTTGSSTFEVDFSVGAPTDFRLQGQLQTRILDHNPRPVDIGATGSLRGGGTTLFTAIANQGPFDVTGTLQPGVTYTLLFHIDATGQAFERSELGLSFTVPEPGSAGLLAFLLFGLRSCATRFGYTVGHKTGAAHPRMSKDPRPSS